MKEMEQSNTKINKGIPYGLVWGTLLFGSYLYLFFFIGIYFFWSNKDINSFMDFLYLALGSAGYLSASGILFLVVLYYSITFIWKDPNFKQSIKNNWPVILAFFYPLLPNLPGPLDEGILSVLMFIIRVILFFKAGKTSKTSN
ncbi:MAG: hypothetical protein O9346_15380 [Leptospiraceae bacterium]|jgi:hypothetical protein|nr:hypothetical protein [Leptospiraceae bacterium]MCZ8347798.1 hypothetical protein [Leptospiraceae bacterium]